MRKIIIFPGIIMLIALWFHSCNPASVDSKKPDEVSFDYLKEHFASPGREYGSAPLWVWHTKITKTIIDSMMNEFKENAFGGVFVHPRPGVITEYLSAEWLDLFKYTVQKGKELGLNVWIYDENSYPSGFAGGLVPYEMEESYNQGQMLHLEKADRLPERMDSVLIVLKEEEGKYKNITDQIETEKGRQGSYLLFKKQYYQKGAGTVGPPEFPYVDLMVKGVAEKFLDITMTKGYETVAGEEFGKWVPGLFSDEAHIGAQGGGNIRWTPDLFDSFQKTWNYRLEEHLPSLFEDVGDWKKVRHNYWQTILQLFIDGWCKPMHAYTEKHNLKWTGHYWEHEWPRPNLGPDNMAIYAWHQQPGIDMLFNQFNEVSPNAQFGNIRSVKELSSVANQLNKERTLSETYGGGGWELTFKDLKRLGDWQAVLGVNFLNQHLSMMTLTGARKYDYPQSFSYHTPWWPYYKSLNEYFTRVNFVLSHGKQVNSILVLEPTTSAWMYSRPGETMKEFSDIGNRFQQFVTRLEKAQVEYDLGSENIIQEHGRTQGAEFIVGDRNYRLVVIPPGMESIDNKTLQLLRAYAEAGGKVILFETLQRVDGAEGSDWGSLNQSNDNIIHASALEPSIIEQHFADESFQIIPSQGDSIGGNLYHHRRMTTDGQILFLSNASMETSSKGTVRVAGKDVVLMDLTSGAILDYPERLASETTDFDFEIPPAGSRMFFIANKKVDGLAEYKHPGRETAIPGSEVNVNRPAENTLMIDFCDLQLGDSSFKDMHVGAASKKVFMHYGFIRNPWNHFTQFKNYIVARDTFSVGTGFTTNYHFTIDGKVDFRQFRAVIEQGQLWKEVKINGQKISPVKDRWWLDRSFSVLAVGEYLKPGTNTLTITANPMSVFAEIEPVYILGDFNLQSASKGWQIIPPAPLKTGSWKNQGLGLYGFSIVYAKDFDLKKGGNTYEVGLGDWKGTVAAVRVNGTPAGVIYSEPDRLAVTQLLKEGANHIEVEIVGSLKNLLGPHHNNPKPGMVGPHHWWNIEKYPAGKDYDTYDYGLMTDFQLWEMGE